MVLVLSNALDFLYYHQNRHKTIHYFLTSFVNVDVWTWLNLGNKEDEFQRNYNSTPYWSFFFLNYIYQIYMSLFICHNKQTMEYTTILWNVDFVHPNITHCNRKKGNTINKWHTICTCTYKYYFILTRCDAIIVILFSSEIFFKKLSNWINA